MNKIKIKKGDKVLIRVGKSKGLSGEVLKVIPKTSQLLVKGVNVVKRHVKPTQSSGEGRIEYKEMPIHVSNVSFVDPESEVPTKIGIRILEDGSRQRFAKATGALVLGRK